MGGILRGEIYRRKLASREFDWGELAGGILLESRGHRGVSALTGKRVKEDNDFAIEEHHFFAIIHLVLMNFSY